ncbi:uncharacterized protein F5891DRAFT_1192056 [Suillus fuscotomentosus]|uniref:Uncharacterized protein n=1 Tax=Suillus fuscotomentosus TaxID=1912939 RepID=A0AAD4E0Z7_9AGAM|nr:uncharacterized protein F5891DRAFT_1192056 [Suillus fuscotomentosus]KAG1897347.1 hypothetical protein F5891DRAFT_1192056 [Suillus fuscotomentosus]
MQPMSHGQTSQCPSIWQLELQSHTFDLPFIGQRLGDDGNHYNLYSSVTDDSDSVVHLALHPMGYEPVHVVGLPILDFTSFPPMPDIVFDLTQTPFIPQDPGMVAPRSSCELSVRSPAVNRLCYNPIAVTSRAHSFTADSSESGLVASSSIIGSSIVETSYMGSSPYPASGGDAKAKSTGAKHKLTLTNIIADYPNWGKALSTLRCMLRVLVCHGDSPNLFLLVMADYSTERKALISSLWSNTLIRCDLEKKDLEKIVTTADNKVMSEADILALGNPWFTLWMYDNKCHASTSIRTSRAGFDLRHIFGIALHDKVMSIIMKLMPPQSNRLPLAINGLVWFLREQITTEMVYHVVFRQNTKPGHRICLADLDPVAFRQAAYPPVATLSLVVTSCYDVLLDSFDDEVKDSSEFTSPSQMHMQICETLPMLFEQSDDPDHTTFMTSMNALCDIKKGDVQRVSRPRRGKKKVIT